MNGFTSDAAFRNKVAVITGAASGFGRAFAMHGAQLGMKLVLADVDQAGLDETAAAATALGAQSITRKIDVAHSAQVAQLADDAYATFGEVHLLFNNAGVGSGGYVWEATEADWQWVMGVNLMGVVHGIRHFVPRMLQAAERGEPGWVMNTASVAGLLCAPLMGVYNVSKHAVVALSETLHHDLRLTGSTVGASVLCPAFVPTGIAQSHRHRPDSLPAASPTPSQRKAQQLTAKAVAAGRMSATQIAALSFDAVMQRRFYVFSHPQILSTVQARFDAVLTQSPPADPYALKPDVGPAAI